LQGRPELARDLALALREANPDDRVAFIVLAAVQPQLGAAREGRLAGVRAFRLSSTEGERYEAARLTALAATNEERYTLSQIWLRRAAINAPDERGLAQTRNDFRGIRNLNPWSVNLRFSITPTNNLNGGSSTDCLFEIDPTGDRSATFCAAKFSGDAQALSGLAATGDVRLEYAISRSAQQRTSLTARGYARAVWLSSDARELAPNSSNSDFGSQTFEPGVNHQRRLGDGTLSAGVTAGWSWFAEELSLQNNTVNLGYATAISDQSTVTMSAEVQQINLQSVDRSNVRSTLTAGLSYITEGGNRIGGNLSYTKQMSDSINEGFEGLTAQMSYAWREPIGPAQVSVSAGVTYSDYPTYTLPLQASGRQDTRIFTSFTAGFNDLEYAGFVPTITVSFQDPKVISPISNVMNFR
jgi:hypothetical protein